MSAKHKSQAYCLDAAREDKRSGLIVRPSSASDEERENDSQAHMKLGVKATALHMGRYELAFQIDSGGFATVYLARTVGPGGFQKVVALKRIHDHLAKNEEFVQMFLDEARIAANVSHPNICPVFDFGEHEGVHYLAMDFLVGEPLADVGPKLFEATAELGTKERCRLAAHIAAAAADGLHAAHETTGDDGKPLGIVHRDVSATNIFIRYDGHVQLVDFGLVSAAEKIHQTEVGIAKGQVAYMSPEQFSGIQIDRRIDIWSLGVVLWELIAGRRLFKRANDAETLNAVLKEAPAKLSEINPEVPAELEGIVDRMLEKDRDKRFQTAFEVNEALRRFLSAQDQSVSGHDIAKWMQTLFPGRKELKLALIEQAKKRETNLPLYSKTTSLENDRARASSSDANATAPRSSSSGSAQIIRTGPPWWAWVLSTVAATSVAAAAAVTLVKPEKQTIEKIKTVVVEKEVPGPTPNVGEKSKREPASNDDKDTYLERRKVYGPHGFVRLITAGVQAEVRHMGKTVGRAGESIMLPPGEQQIEIVPDRSDLKTKLLQVEVSQKKGRRYRIQFEKR